MTPHRLQRLLTAPPLLLLGSLASADAISGRVVNESGVGVAGVDIDLISLGSGGNPHELNDGTDVNGNFLTTVDPGVYEVRFYPPPPPATTLLTGVVTSIVVAGTKNMGTITLVAGVSVVGTTKNSAAVPVGNVKVDVFNATTGAKYHMKGNVTNAFGNFNLAVPANTPLRSQLLTNGVVGQVLVPREMLGTVTGATNLGVMTMQTGFHVTGTVRTQTSAPVSGADIDVTDLATGNTLFTPGDNTNSLGIFDVVVPAGTFDLEVNRPGALVLVGVDVDNLAVSAATNVGILTMRNGVFLSGTVRDRFGAVVQGADVNVYEASTGLSVALGSDNTNVAGFYSVVVPTALLHVVFSPPGIPHILAKDRHNFVNVTVNTILDGRLPGAPGHVTQHPNLPKPYLPLGSGTPGTGGSVPHIRVVASGTAEVTLWVSGGRPLAQARLLFGFEEHASSTQPELHLVRPLARLAFRLDEQGAAQLTLPLPSAGLLGRTLYSQLAVIDPEAQAGFAVSHVLALRTE